MESQVSGEHCTALLCKTQNVSVAISCWLPSGEVLVTLTPGSWLGCSGWMLHSWLLLFPLALAV